MITNVHKQFKPKSEKMKKLVLIISTLILANFCQAQYQFTELTSPSSENLLTAKIVENGDIYVFGCNAFGAKSSDNGETWEILSDIDSQSRIITACGSDVGQMYISGINGLSKINSSQTGWSDNPLCMQGDVEKIASDNYGNIYFFPKTDGLGSRYEIMKYEINGIQYSTRLLYDFYLPLPKINPYATNFNYQSCITGDNRIITFLHNMDNGLLNYIYVSDDQGASWQEIDIPFSTTTTVRGISFNGNTGFIIGSDINDGCNHMYSSVDNGETWNLVCTSSLHTESPQSIYVDYDGFNYHSILVGLMAETGHGFVKIDDGFTTDLTNTALNYVTGNEEKIVIVGDNGKVFLGIKPSLGKEENKTIIDLQIYPNPVSSYIEIRANKEMGIIKLFDLSGKNLQNFACKSQRTKIDVSNLSKGIYIVQVDGISKKIIKQ